MSIESSSSKSQQSKNNFFNQVARSSFAPTDHAIDPLSAFLQQEDSAKSKIEEEKIMDSTKSSTSTSGKRDYVVLQRQSVVGSRNTSEKTEKTGIFSDILSLGSSLGSSVKAAIKNLDASDILQLNQNQNESATTIANSPNEQPFHNDNPLQSSSSSAAVIQTTETYSEDNNAAVITEIEEQDVELDDIPFLTGEHKLISLTEAFIQVTPGKLLSGTLYMTNYRMYFDPPSDILATLAVTNPSIHSWLNVPLACIDRVEKEKKSKDQRSIGVTIVVYCKDVRQLRIILQTKKMSENDIDRAVNVMLTYAFPNNMLYLFAFSHSLPGGTPHDTSLNRVDDYDVMQEFSRQGILDGGEHCMWRVSTANKDYRLCNSYPKLLVLPRFITDEDALAVSSFRAGHRLPVLSWGDKYSGATIWRSSQPKAGVSGSCSQDEKFLEILAQSCKSQVRQRMMSSHGSHLTHGFEPVLHIVDCRPRSSAMANRAAGAGYESQANYPNSKLEFYNIGNIHAMRDSFRSLVSVLLNNNSNSQGGGADASFGKQIEDTMWLSHVRLVLKAAWETANFISKGMAVLVHCSHGWDRTAQVCTIAQLFLDPYYRTIEGFKTLIEKEWCSFGHQFQLRCAHGQDKNSRQDDQISPIFIQVLDCVWQLVNQYPQYFEFNGKYLIAIADHIYSGRFGTFLFNCDSDRELHSASDKCLNLWTYLHYNRGAFYSPLYSLIQHRLFLPPLSQILRNVGIWKDYFYRWTSYPSLISAPDSSNKFLFEDGICRNSQLPELMDCFDLKLPAIVTSENYDYWFSLHGKGKSEITNLQHQLTSSMSMSMSMSRENSMSTVYSSSSLIITANNTEEDEEKLDDNEQFEEQYAERNLDCTGNDNVIPNGSNHLDFNSQDEGERELDITVDGSENESLSGHNSEDLLPIVQDSTQPLHIINDSLGHDIYQGVIERLKALLKQSGVNEDLIEEACLSVVST